jgi:hypothetical protein
MPAAAGMTLNLLDASLPPASAGTKGNGMANNLKVIVLI